MTLRIAGLCSALVMTLALGTARPVFAVTFTKIAGTADDPPGIVGPLTDLKVFSNGFVDFNQAPAVDSLRRVLFIGASADGAHGIFIGNNPLAGSTPVEIVRVTDTSVDPLGTVHTFAAFSFPTLSDAWVGVAHRGRDSLFRSGIFARFSPTPSVIIEKSIVSFLDPVPGSNFLFNSTGDPILSSDGYLAFEGDWFTGTAQLPNGVFITPLVTPPVPQGPPFVRVAMTGDDPPGPIGPLVRILNHATNGEDVSFLACDGVIATLEYDKCAVFLAQVYPTASVVLDINRIQPIVSKGDLLPDPVGGQFEFPIELDMDEDHIAFLTSVKTNGGFTTGLYLMKIDTTTAKKEKEKAKTNTNKIEKIYIITDSPPSPLTRYWTSGRHAVSKGRVMFWAGDGVGSAEGNHGLLLSSPNGGGPGPQAVVHTAMDLDGKRIQKISFHRDGFNYPYFAFGVQFVDGTQAIYRGDLSQ